jgi:ribose transport system permease protein
MRTPSFDLSLQHPAMRKRMTRRLPPDEWLFPNVNTGGVFQFDDNLNIIRTMGDLTGGAHPSVTSMREHKGYLFIGGIFNNRIGRLKLDGADENWTAMDAYWGQK